MSKKTEKANKRKNSKVWLYASIGVISVLVLSYLTINNMYQSVSSNRQQVGGWALALVVVALPALGVLILSIIKLKEWKKLVPGIGIVLVTLIALSSYSIYWFSQYSSF